MTSRKSGRTFARGDTKVISADGTVRIIPNSRRRARSHVLPENGSDHSAFKFMESRYAGTCIYCLAKIPEGRLIGYRTGEIAHQACIEDHQETKRKQGVS